ncbi:MAG TPA: hypothetical protein VHD36_00680 [Pirellulales bacterium]|nr:hypothetical protein [Pirellulales bacterium]
MDHALGKQSELDNWAADFCSFVKRRLNGSRPKKGEITAIASEYCMDHPEKSPSGWRKQWQRYGRLFLDGDENLKRRDGATDTK